MPISRPLLIVLAAAVLALVGFYATQGGRQSTGDEAAEVAPPPLPTSEDGPTSVAVKPDGPAAAEPKAKTGRSAGADRTDGAKAGADRIDGTKAGRAESAAAREAAAAKSAARRRARAERIGMPLSVSKALEARKTVVLFFRGSPSADDHATARAVAGLRGRGVAVFSDRIGKLGRYRAVVGDLGISQAPAVVIVDRKRSARVVQGYVDPTTLAQDVADSR